MLNARDLRLHGFALTAVGWMALAWSQASPGAFDRFGTLRGVDFLQFYASAWLVSHGRVGELYDFQAFAAHLPILAPGVNDLLYLPIYPPQLALAMAPLGGVAYLPALGAWTTVSLGLYLTTAWQALTRIPGLLPWRKVAWPLALGFPPLLLLVAHGQIAALALPLLLGTWLAFSAGRVALMGLALGLMAFKPTLGAFALAALVLAPSWRLAAGILAGIAAEAAAVAATLGIGPLVAYHDVIRELVHSAPQFEPKLWAMHNLRGAAYLAFGQTSAGAIAYAAAICVTVWWARRAWQRHGSPLLRFAVLGVTGMLLNPHLYVYDLVLLLVPMACLAAWLLERQSPADRAVALVAYSLVWLPMLGPLAMYTSVQPTALVLMSLLWLLSRAEVS